MPLDLVGNLTVALQTTILFLLVLGLPFSKRRPDKVMLIRHGYLTVAALILHTLLVFVVMIPVFTSNLGLSTYGLSQSTIYWSHIVLASTAEVAATIIVVEWLVYSPSKMRCWRFRRWMTPLFLIWVISLIGGTLIHVLQIT